MPGRTMLAAIALGAMTRAIEETGLARGPERDGSQTAQAAARARADAKRARKNALRSSTTEK